MSIFLKSGNICDCTSIGFLDSTPEGLPQRGRIHQHKTFKGIAMTVQCCLGWLYGFKLYVFINYKGGIIDFVITAEILNNTMMYG